MAEFATHNIEATLLHILQIAPVLAMAFSAQIKREVRARQDNTCDCCGEQEFLEVHHRVPESQEGEQVIENAVGACRPCHKVIDKEAFAGLIYPQVHTHEGYYPQGNGLPVKRERPEAVTVLKLEPFVG